MRIEDLIAEILVILPNAEFSEVDDGELVIYTNKIEDHNGVLWELED